MLKVFVKIYYNRIIVTVQKEGKKKDEANLMDRKEIGKWRY